MTINVAEVDRAPVITEIDSLGRGEGETVDITVGGSDPDLPANTLTWQATGLPSGLSIDTAGHIVGTIASGAAGGSPYNVTVTLTDNGSPTMNDTEQFSFEVSDTNLSPILGPIGTRSALMAGLDPALPGHRHRSRVHVLAFRWSALRRVHRSAQPACSVGLQPQAPGKLR